MVAMRMHISTEGADMARALTKQEAEGIDPVEVSAREEIMAYAEELKNKSKKEDEKTMEEVYKALEDAFDKRREGLANLEEQLKTGSIIHTDKDLVINQANENLQEKVKDIKRMIESKL